MQYVTPMRAFSYKKEVVVLTPRTCFLSVREGIELANKAVKRSLSGDLKPVTRSPRGKYNTYTQERARIGKYAADNGATKADTHFSKLLDRKIGESNVFIVQQRCKLCA